MAHGITSDFYADHAVWPTGYELWPTESGRWGRLPPSLSPEALFPLSDHADDFGLTVLRDRLIRVAPLLELALEHSDVDPVEVAETKADEVRELRARFVRGRGVRLSRLPELAALRAGATEVVVSILDQLRRVRAHQRAVLAGRLEDIYVDPSWADQFEEAVEGGRLWWFQLTSVWSGSDGRHSHRDYPAITEPDLVGSAFTGHLLEGGPRAGREASEDAVWTLQESWRNLVHAGVAADVVRKHLDALWSVAMGGAGLIEGREDRGTASKRDPARRAIEGLTSLVLKHNGEVGALKGVTFEIDGDDYAVNREWASRSLTEVMREVTRATRGLTQKKPTSLAALERGYEKKKGHEEGSKFLKPLAEWTTSMDVWLDVARGYATWLREEGEALPPPTGKPGR